MDKLAGKLSSIGRGISSISKRFARKPLQLELPGVSRGMSPNTSKWLKRGVYGTVATAGVGGAGYGAYKFGPSAMNSMSLRKHKGAAYFKDKSKQIIVWKTYPGGPILEGPTQQMLELFKVGKRDRKAGIVMLAKLMKQGIIRKVGTA